MSILTSKGENSQTFFNFLSTAISSGIAFLTMPIFTRLLGAEQFGMYSIYHAWLTILLCFMGLNVNSALGIGFYKYKEKYLEFRTSTQMEGTLISACMIGILMGLYPLLKPVFGYSFLLFSILLLHTFGNFIVNFASSAWVYEKHAAKNMITATTLLVVTSFLSIVLLLVWNSDAPLFYGRVIGTALPYIVVGAIIWVLLFKEKPSGFNREYWKYSALFGLPMVFHMLSHQVLGQSDRLMMQWFDISGSEIGIYSFFYSFVAILTTILNALNTSWCPFLYDDLSKKDYPRIDQRIAHYVEIFVIMCVGFLLVAREVMKLFANSEYWSGAPLVPILVISVYCTFFYQFAVNYEFFNSKPRYVAIGTVIAAACNILFNALTIPRWGMYGAAVSTLASYFILMVIHTIIVKTWKLEKYPLTYKPVLIGLFAVLFGCSIYIYFPSFTVVRWILALILGAYLVVRVYRRKTIF